VVVQQAVLVVAEMELLQAAETLVMELTILVAAVVRRIMAETLRATAAQEL
jgi:hypothetical protein